MKVSRNWLQTYFYSEIPAVDKLSELFTFHSFEVEGVEKIEAKGKAPEDFVMDVKILPDRAHYCLSHRGVAEEVHVITGMPLKKDRDTGKPPEGNRMIATPKIIIEDNNFCRRYMGRRVEGVKVSESPEWMEKYLEAIGERSINNIVDASNIIMFDIGQPLHIFDADKVRGEIKVRAAHEGEKILLLDGKEVTLKSNDFVVSDDEGPLAIAGVKGGKRAGITAETKNIIIESANFDPTAVRRTSTELNLRNESSKRFENEITPELASLGMTMISALVAELCPETRSSASDIIDVYPVKPDQTKIKVSREYVNIRLGIEISEKDYGEILSRLGISDNSNILTIPYNRLDLTKPEDIVEEVGRIYGYEKIMGKLPVPPAKPVTILPIYYLSEKIKNILIAAGFSEVYTYTLVSNGDIETAYPISKDKAFARKNMTDGMFECVKKNSANADLLELEEVCVFEMGRTFTKDKESTMLALGVAQIKKVKGRKSEDVLTEALQALYSALGIKNVPDLSKKIIIKNNCAVVELDLEELLAAYPMPADASYADLGFGPASSVSYEKISAYPFITRDIAVFVQPTVTASDVWSSIIKGVDGAGAQKILNKYSIYSKSTSPKAPFDTFEKDGKKSYAFRLAFQSMEKTLTDADAGNVMDKIYSEMKVKGWEVR